MINKIVLVIFMMLVAEKSISQTVELSAYSGRTSLQIQDPSTQQEYTIQVFLPKDYSGDRKYPVIYLLDADNTLLMNFYLSTIDALVYYNSIPKSIIVGVNQKDRSKELGILKDTTSRGFLAFIRKTLPESIDGKYATVGYNSYVGHSLGGQLLTYGFINFPEDFYSTLTVSSALLYPNQQKLFENEIISPLQDALRHTKGSAYYYSAVGNSGFQDSQFVNGIREVERVFESHQSSLIHFQFNYLDGYTHAISPYGSLASGLVYLFKDWSFPEDLAMKILIENKIDGLEALQHQLRFINEKYRGKDIPLPDHIYDNLYSNHFGKEEYQKAISIMQLKLKSTNHADTYLKIAECYKNLGDTVAFERYFQKAEPVNR